MDFKVFVESTLDDLYSSTVNAFPKTTLRQHAVDPIRITQLSIIPFKGMKTIYFKGLAQNEGREYNSTIIFKSVKYDAPNSLRIMADDGLVYHVKKLSTDINEVLVRCQCKDFYWRGVYANFLDGSLYGKNRKKYESLGIRPPANPTNAPMLCKHLIKLAQALRDSGILLA